MPTVETGPNAYKRCGFDPQFESWIRSYAGWNHAAAGRPAQATDPDYLRGYTRFLDAVKR